MTTGLRECCGIIETTIGPEPARHRPLPHTKFEVRKFLNAAIRQSDAESWHKAQLHKVSGQPDLTDTGFRKVCGEVGVRLLKGCKSIGDLRFWAETGLVPKGIYNERHLLNVALGHVKSAFEAMEIIAKTPKLKQMDGPARPIAVQYFVQIYLLLLVLVKVAYAKEFDDYFEEWYHLLDDPDKVVEFDTLEPSEDEKEFEYVNYSVVVAPLDKVPITDFPFREAGPKQIPKVFVSDRPYGKMSIMNLLADIPEEASGDQAGAEKRSVGLVDVEDRESIEKRRKTAEFFDKLMK